MAQQQLGLDWEEDFQRLTPSEFFRKNKQMLGFTGKIRSVLRSEERRVGKECRSRWSPYH